MLGTLVAVVVSTVAAAVVGARALGVAKRTRQLPETSVGMGLVAFALAQLGVMLATGLGGASAPGMSQALRAFILFNLTIASLGLSLFTLETFGRTAWRCVLAASIVVTGAALRFLIYYQDIAILGTGGSHSVIPSLGALTFSMGFVWLGIEGLQYHRRARRAQAIGLASAEIVSRFLVLGIGGLLGGLFATAAAVANLTEGPLADLRSYFVGAGGVVTAVMFVLAFAPPAAYRNFIEARAAREPGHG